MADNMISAALSRQKGLMKELLTVTNNIANADTAGYRAEGVVFSEYVEALDKSDSLSMTRAAGRTIDMSQGEIITTKDPLDIAISGDGFFLVETEGGPRLTRAGHFSLNHQGEIVDNEGRRVLGEGASAIAIPQGAQEIAVSAGGDISADGQLVGRFGVVTAPQIDLVREGDNLFRAANGYEPVLEPSVTQGALEGSNVNAMGEFVRLIEVQRAYEGTKGFLDKEADRLKQLVETLGRPE
ncbi:MAG: flagellar hook-basal body complex protein [Pseudomonadota bacterium]